MECFALVTLCFQKFFFVVVSFGGFFSPDKILRYVKQITVNVVRTSKKRESMFNKLLEFFFAKNKNISFLILVCLYCLLHFYNQLAFIIVEQQKVFFIDRTQKSSGDGEALLMGGERAVPPDR